MLITSKAESRFCLALSATPVGGHLSEALGASSFRGLRILDIPVAVMIDGGHTRALAKKSKINHNPDFVESLALSCVLEEERLLRILYYDCAPYVGNTKLPVSGTPHEFKGSDQWLRDLAARDLFAVRRGVLKFRGFKPKKIPIAHGAALTDADFRPDFEQKGVDMRIGLDMASFSEKRTVQRIILVTADTDCLPAMKHARKAGLQVVLINLPDQKLAPELLWHADFKRPIGWPLPRNP